MRRIELVVIDPQHDFCNPNGSLFVKGAAGDMERLARLVKRLAPKLHDVHVTLDSHRRVDISHPMWWRDSAGKPPTPFTLISASDLADGRWTTTQPSAHRRSLDYLRALEATNRYAHVIWPEHCLIGSEGHQVVPVLLEALHEWEAQYAVVDFVTKGSNPWTEHFSAVRAEVPDPNDPTTQINTRLVRTLEEADVILLAGEARSHCMANTVRDIADCFSDPACIRKLVLLVDATSDVSGFEQLGEAFVKDLVAKGMQVTDTAQFLATA